MGAPLGIAIRPFSSGPTAHVWTDGRFQVAPALQRRNLPRIQQSDSYTR
jgi:hypothetical protein